MVQSNLFAHQAGNGKQPQPQRTFHETGGAAPAACAASPRAQQAPRRPSEAASRIRPAAPATRSNAQNGSPVRLSGRIGRYFVLKRTRSGTLLAVFSMATVKPCRDQSGNWTKKIAWQRIVVWGEAAQAVGQRLRPGAPVSVEGRLKTWEWTDSENRLHTTTELVARQVCFLDATDGAMAA